MLCIILAIVTFLVYANTLLNGYVLDDGMVLRNNAFVKNGIKGIPDILTSTRTAGVELYFTNDFYRPLSMVMFALEVQLFGFNPAVSHFFNIVSFIGCVIMLFRFLMRFFGRKRIVVAFIAAALFALHPIHTEVVANIKSRDELLCYFFALWSLSLLWDYVEKGKIWQLLTGILTLFLAYLSKETVITFAAIIPLLFFITRKTDKKRALLVLSGFVVVTAVFLLLRMEVLERFNANGSTNPAFIENALIGAPDYMSRLATAILVLGKYLCLLFVPYPLICDYAANTIPFTNFNSIWVWMSLLLYLALFSVAILRIIRNRRDEWAFAILFYLITISLFTNIVFLVGAEMADRFLFFASTGFCMIVALAVERWLMQRSTEAITLTAAGKIVLLILLIAWGGTTVARNMDWKDNYTLYKADLEKAPDNARLHYWLAGELWQQLYNRTTDTAQQHQLDMQAIQLLQQAKQIYPGFASAISEVGCIYEREHRYDSAIYYDELAVNTDPNEYTGHYNLGSVYYVRGNYTQAIESINKAIVLNPKLKIAYLTRANCYLQLNNFDQAIADGEKALEFGDDADAHQVVGNAYLRKKDFEDAITHFKMVLALKPQYFMAINNLGIAYLYQGNNSLAIEQFNKAIAIHPQYLISYSNLARAFFATGRYDKVIETVSKELAINPAYDDDAPILAQSYQRIGNMELAKKYEEKAKHLYPDFKLQ